MRQHIGVATVGFLEKEDVLIVGRE